MMASLSPTPCEDSLEGPDFNLALPLALMTARLDDAANNGAGDYLPLWRQMLATIGADAGLMWQGVFPTLLIGSSSDAQNSERRRLADSLYDHLNAAGFRHDLMQSLTAKSANGGVNPSADAAAVAHATMQAVRRFLAAGCRILINPEGNRIEAGGWPPANDQAIADCRAYFAAACCQQPQAQIRSIVEQFGQRTDGGWLVLRADAPFFSKVRPAFEAWKVAMAAISANDSDDDADAPFWAIVDVAEKVIEQSAEVGRRVAEIRLWVGLQHSLLDRPHCAAAASEDLDALAALASRFDWPVVLTLRAIAALRGAPWVAA